MLACIKTLHIERFKPATTRGPEPIAIKLSDYRLVILVHLNTLCLLNTATCFKKMTLSLIV